MRPHRLRVTAFGPFPGTVEVDLDEVGGAGPFLLRGATGAGKTSLLDAVGYALFGKVPGARGLKQLRSHHAPDGVRTSVELWAGVAGRAVHVVRTPDQSRPRARGTGTTTDRSSVTVRVARDLAALEADDCDARYSGVQEANDELARLVGMTHEQFVQVVLLPQGEFARFLRARDDERAAVLRALFDTGRFGAVEQHLRARRDAARAALAEAGDGLGRAVAAVAALTGTDDVPTDVPGWATGVLAASREDVARSEALAEQAAAAFATADGAHRAALGRTALLTDLLEAHETRERVAGDATAVAALEQELAAADRAVEVVPLRAAEQQARWRAEEALATAVAALEALGPEDAWPGPGSPADRLDEVCRHVEARTDEARRDATGLEVLGREVERWETLHAQARRQQAALDEAEEELRSLRTTAAGLPDRVRALEAELTALRGVADGLDGLTRDVHGWDALARQVETLGSLVAEATTAEAGDLAAREAQRRADTTLDRLRRARLDGMAAELAATLAPGEPCVVCGGTEHPAPAAPGDEVVDAAAEEAAGLAAAARADEAGRARAVLERVAGRRDEAYDQLVAAAGDRVVVPDRAQLSASGVEGLRTTVGEARDAATAQQQAAGAAAAAAVGLDAELDATRRRQAELEAATADAEAVRAAAGAAVAATADQLEQVGAVLVTGLGPGALDPSPRQPWADLASTATGRLSDLADAGEALQRLEHALTDATRTARATADACSAAGWSDVAAAVAAHRPRAWRDTARHRTDSHRRDLHEVDRRIARLVERLTGPVTEPGTEPDAGRAATADGDVTQVAAALEVARRAEQELADALAVRDGARREADGALARDRRLLDDLERTVPRLLAAERATGPLQARADAAASLADLCSGANDKGIPLSTYVLAAHLEHVVQAANQRLAGMSDGRYELVHVEEGEDRRRRAGLGLAVLDAWTGVQRPAGTLSGGETFLASLALALGLADVVTAEAGGVRIDALFVDEGFGTLDPDSLDRAVDVLDQLQENGRLVGVVSHVGELRQRLPRQVHVVAGRHGSTVSVLTG